MMIQGTRMYALKEKSERAYKELVSEFALDVEKSSNQLVTAFKLANEVKTVQQVENNAKHIQRTLDECVKNLDKLRKEFFDEYNNFLNDHLDRYDCLNKSPTNSDSAISEGTNSNASYPVIEIDDVEVLDDDVQIINEDVQILNHSFKRPVFADPSVALPKTAEYSTPRSRNFANGNGQASPPMHDSGDVNFYRDLVEEGSSDTSDESRHPAVDDTSRNPAVDEKLNSECCVLVENLREREIAEFVNVPEKTEKSEIDKKLAEERAFQRLINLDNIERKRSKRTRGSSDSENSSRLASSKRTKTTAQKKEETVDASSESDSDISDVSYSSYDRSTTESEHSCHPNREEGRLDSGDESEERIKQMLLNSDDDDGDDESDSDSENTGDEQNKVVEKKKGSKERQRFRIPDPSDSSSDDDSNLERRKKSAWKNDPLLNFRLDDSEFESEKKGKSSSADEKNSSDDSLHVRRKKKKSSKLLSSDSDQDECSDNHVSSSSTSSSEVECLESDGQQAADENSSIVLLNEEPQAVPSCSAILQKGRRNIRKIFDDAEIDILTKEAKEKEENRQKRILQRKHQLEETIEKTANTSKEVLVLDRDPVTKKELVVVDGGLTKHLKDHQKKGVSFMWESCFESLEEAKKSEGSGCILAHFMGLGKTFQIITLVHTLLSNDDIPVSTVMVVCPKSTVSNWIEEFNIWQEGVENKKKAPVYEIAENNSKTAARIKILESWHNKGGVFIVSYEMFRSMVLGKKAKHYSPKQRESLKSLLLDPGADLVVCDEGHLLKSETSKVSAIMQNVKTKRRISLTGTPLQNNLDEYHCMVQFVKPHLLGTKMEFANMFVNPIKNGQYADSTPYDVQLMKKRAYVLHHMLEGCVQRCDYTVLNPYLPQKQEYVIYIKLSPVQEVLYKHFVENVVLDKRKGLLSNYHTIQQLVAHPKIMSDSVKKQKNKQVNEDPWWKDLVNQQQLDDYNTSSKMIVLFSFLKECEANGDKILVFSQSLRTLDLIEKFLKQISDNKVENPFDFKNRWENGKDYYRIEGKTSSDQRKKLCKKFNNPEEKRVKLFLISTKSGGLGINLTGANRVIIFDPSFNPSNDYQASCRVYRFGQVKPCYIYRFLSSGTMEEKIYNRQVSKLSMSLRVLDEQQIERHFQQPDLANLYLYEPSNGKDLIELNDPVLAKVCPKYKNYICNYIEHETLLMNKEDELLNESEKKEAVEEYEAKRILEATQNEGKRKNQKKQKANDEATATENALNSDTSIEDDPDTTESRPQGDYLMSISDDSSPDKNSDLLFD